MAELHHEYTNPEVMFAGIGGRPDKNDFAAMTADHIGVEMAAHGISVVEIALDESRWRVLGSSPFNRRITASTEMSVDGPATHSGH
jgi:secreted PhoX family phosphatase